MNIAVRLYNNAIANKERRFGIWYIAMRKFTIEISQKLKEKKKLLSKLKRISARGNNAEVKQDRDGNWIVYEVKKIKAVV